jgi:LmbE family N-acetylglucosaminyl deacetylase
VAGVFAHPDDDTYGLAGTYLLVGGRIDLTLVVATSGESGVMSPGSGATRATLASVREREEREALHRAGMDAADVHWLRHEDGGLENVPREDLAAQVVYILREARPEVVVTFGPGGVTKHPDHVRIGDVATKAFHHLREQRALDGSFARLYYSEIAGSVLERFYDALRARGHTDVDPSAPFMPQGVPDRTIAARVDCREVLDQKIHVIRAHATQMEEFEFTPPELHVLLHGFEWFVQAWPPREEGAPVLSSPFDGFD